METVSYPHNWGEGKNLDNCPFCNKLPTSNTAPIKVQPIFLFPYMGVSPGADWACPSCGSIFDKNNNLLVMGKVSDWAD